MKAAFAGVLVLSIAPACSTLEDEEPAEVIDYACNDVVAIGRVKTQSYTDFSSENDLLGHGRFDMQVSIKRILRGAETRAIVPASRISHGQLVANRDFLMVLSPDANRSYTLGRATLARGKSRLVLARTCE